MYVARFPEWGSDAAAASSQFVAIPMAPLDTARPLASVTASYAAMAAAVGDDDRDRSQQAHTRAAFLRAVEAARRVEGELRTAECQRVQQAASALMEREIALDLSPSAGHLGTQPVPIDADNQAHMQSLLTAAAQDWERDFEDHDGGTGADRCDDDVHPLWHLLPPLPDDPCDDGGGSSGGGADADADWGFVDHTPNLRWVDPVPNTDAVENGTRAPL